MDSTSPSRADMNLPSNDCGKSGLPHVLRLADPGPSASLDPGMPTTGYLTTDRQGWTATRDIENALVFPTGVLARRYAARFLHHNEQTWMPEVAPDRISTIPRKGGACRDCGCTEQFACPSGCAWTEPDLCSECARPHEPLITWAVYDKPVDYPLKAVARKFVDGVPTDEVRIAGSLSALRTLKPAGVHVIPRASEDLPTFVELWV